MRDSGAVHPVVTDHAAERPDQHFGLVHRFQMQHIPERRNAWIYVTVLACHCAGGGGQNASACADRPGGLSYHGQEIAAVHLIAFSHGLLLPAGWWPVRAISAATFSTINSSIAGLNWLT